MSERFDLAASLHWLIIRANFRTGEDARWDEIYSCCYEQALCRTGTSRPLRHIWVTFKYFELMLHWNLFAVLEEGFLLRRWSYLSPLSCKYCYMHHFPLQLPFSLIILRLSEISWNTYDCWRYFWWWFSQCCFDGMINGFLTSCWLWSYCPKQSPCRGPSKLTLRIMRLKRLSVSLKADVSLNSTNTTELCQLS